MRNLQEGMSNPMMLSNMNLTNCSEGLFEENTVCRLRIGAAAMRRTCRIIVLVVVDLDIWVYGIFYCKGVDIEASHHLLDVIFILRESI